MCSRRLDIIRIVSNSFLYLLSTSEHCGSADFERRSIFEKVFRDRNAADLSCTLDRGLMVVRGPIVRCVEQLRSLCKHFPYFLQVSMTGDYELTD